MEPKKTFFLKQALRSIKTSGSFVPSSKRLAKRMLKHIDFEKAQIIVEFGPGTGVITLEILKRIHPKSQLICFETNPAFYKQLKLIKHPQLKLINTSAENLQAELQKSHCLKACAVISSLPLSNIPKNIAIKILQNAKKSLKKEGIFVQFQYSIQHLKMLRKIFNKVSIDFEPINFPPAFVYKCI